jgi:hypothetical protein
MALKLNGLPVGVEGKRPSQGGFTWHYKGCPCCGRAQPDSKAEIQGERCELCQHQKVLLDEAPEGWFEIVEEIDPQGRVGKVRSRWFIEWENRPYDSLCPHERAWLESNKLKAKGWETRRKKAGAAV